MPGIPTKSLQSILNVNNADFNQVSGLGYGTSRELKKTILIRQKTVKHKTC